MRARMGILRKIFVLSFIAAINILICWLILSPQYVVDTWKPSQHTETTLSAHVFVDVLVDRDSNAKTSNVNIEYPYYNRNHSFESTKCPDIVTGMTQGRWLTRPLTQQEQITIDKYLQDERGAYHIPPTFQRRDGRCGIIPYEGSPLYRHMWFKAICDPKGQTPCCFTNRCVSLSEEECKCPTCYDERQAIHAEYATWKPQDERCDVKVFKKDQACNLLRGSTVYFVGDSFIRHLFAAFVILLTGNEVDGALKRNINPFQRERCKGMHQITGLTCRELLKENRLLCNDTVRVKYMQVFPSKEFPFATSALRSLRHVKKSLIVLGIGIHDDFNVSQVAKRFLLPFLNLRQYLSTNLTSDLDLRNVLTYFGNSEFYNGNYALDVNNFHFVQKKNKSQDPSFHYDYLQERDPDKIMRDIGIDFHSINMFNKLYNPSWQNFISKSGIDFFSNAGSSSRDLNGPSNFSPDSSAKSNTYGVRQVSDGATNNDLNDADKDSHVTRRLLQIEVTASNENKKESVNNTSPGKTRKGVEILSVKNSTIRTIKSENENISASSKERKSIGKLHFLANNYTNETVIFKDFPDPEVDVEHLWPRLLWVGTHAPGLLKSPKFVAQRPEGVQHYNNRVSQILKRWKVPFFDTFSFTDGAVSFDGTHYGYGINMLKVNMILTYIQESLAKESEWK